MATEIKKRRRDKDLSIDEAAKRAGISPRAWAYQENEDVRMVAQVDTQRAIAKALGVKPKVLFDVEGYAK